MKLLYIPARKLMENRDGGGVETQKMYRALLRIAEEHPEVQLDILSDDLPEVSCHLKSAWICRIFGHSLPFYFAWRKIRRQYLKSNYDTVILGISRLGFVARDFKLHSYKSQKPVRIIAQFQNVEANQVAVNAASYEGLSRELFTFAEERAVCRDEGSMIKYMDTGIFLSNRDKAACQEIYGYEGHALILPICVEQKDLSALKTEVNRLHLVFFGSLKFKPNQEGVLWFLRYVWKDIQNNKGLRLIIAGSEPTKDFVSEMRAHKDVAIYNNYDRIEPLLPSNSLFISPIIRGSGMKTKVADALSLGIPVVGTKESMAGYEEALQKKTRALSQADSPEEFIAKIDEIYHNYTETDFLEVRLEAIRLWKRFYSPERAAREIYKLLFVK